MPARSATHVPTQASTLEAAPSVQADLLGDATPLNAPVTANDQPRDQAPSSADTLEPKPAEDENLPGFIGERNLPHP